jgi:hypothetical protein
MRYKDWQLNGPIHSPIQYTWACMRGRKPRIRPTQPPLRVRLKRTWELFWMLNELGWPALTKFEFACLKRICPIYLRVRRFFRGH